MTRRTLALAARFFLAGLALVGCLAGCSAGRAGSAGQNDANPSGPVIDKLGGTSRGTDAQTSTEDTADSQPGAQAPSDNGGATNPDVQAVAMVHTELHETVQTHTVKSPRLAQQIYEAYLRGEAGEVVDTWATDYDDVLTFTLSDGSTVTASFNAHNLRDGDVYREFDDKGGLWSMLAEMDD